MPIDPPLGLIKRASESIVSIIQIPKSRTFPHRSINWKMNQIRSSVSQKRLSKLSLLL